MTGKEYAELLNTRKRVKNQRAEIAHMTADLRDWCNALGITDPEEVGKAVLNRI